MYFKAAQDTQQATHPRLHVRDTRDAHAVFEAVRQGFLRPVTRRLNESERSIQVQSGAVFVWEECDDESGLKRWTDGRICVDLCVDNSFMQPYLFYDEKLSSDGVPNAADQINRSPTFRFVDGTSRSGHSSSALLHQDRSGGQHLGLVKQAYSAWVMLSPNSKPRKWHLTAYFTYADLPSIPTTDRDPLLRKIIIPAGIYRGGKSRTRNEDSDGHGAEMTAVLPPLHSTVGSYPASILQGRPHLQRSTSMTEDQRVIRMLNSRHHS